MSTIAIRPSRLRSFGDTQDAVFCLITNEAHRNRFTIENGHGYRSVQTYVYDGTAALQSLVADTLPERAHVLVISPDHLVTSPDPDALGHRKLIAMACNSTPTNLDVVEHFMSVMERTDPLRQAALASHVFECAERSKHLEIRNERLDTHAVFEHFAGDYEWNQQAGLVGWGEQQLGPSGELSVLPVDVMRYEPERRFQLEGEIPINGRPVIHAGAASYSPIDQDRIYRAIAAAETSPVIATVRGGEIVSLRGTGSDSATAVEMLEALFAVDSRYRVIWEIGFGINTDLALHPGNVGMNEPFGGTNGVFHFGVGLTPHTQYAPIFICPDTTVLTDDGTLMLGSTARRTSIPRKNAGCPCTG